MERTPTTGVSGRIALTKLGKNLLVVIPMAIGAKTTCEEGAVRTLAGNCQVYTVNITYLHSRHGNTGSVNRNDGSKDSLANQRSHDDRAKCGSSSHENRKSNVTTSNVGTEITGLTSVDGSNENHTGKEGRTKTSSSSKGQGKNRHHSVAKSELHKDRLWLRGNFDKVLRGKGDTHGKHKSGQSSREVFGGEPSKVTWFLQGPHGKENSPEWEQGGGKIGSLGVDIEDFGAQARFFLWL